MAMSRAVTDRSPALINPGTNMSPTSLNVCSVEANARVVCTESSQLAEQTATPRNRPRFPLPCQFRWFLDRLQLPQFQPQHRFVDNHQIILHFDIKVRIICVTPIKLHVARTNPCNYQKSNASYAMFD